jgi:hypothetical protein
MRRFTLPIALTFAVLLAASLAGATYSAFFAKTNATNTFATAATFATPCPTSMPSTVFMTGFEAGKSGNAGGAMFTSATNGTSGLDGVDTATKRTGGYSMRLSPNGAMAFRSRTSPAGVRSFVQRFAIRLNALPAADVKELTKSTALNSTLLRLGYKASTQRFTLSFGSTTAIDAATLVESSVTVTAGTWYVIDMRHEASNNPNAAHWRIDGVPQASTSKAVAAADMSTLSWGSNWPNSPMDSYTVNFDDMLYSHTSADYPIGDGRVHALKPNASGTHNAAGVMQMDATTTVVDTTAWNRLDDVPLEGLTDYVKQTAVSTTAYAEVGFEDTTQTCIRAVRGYMTYDPQNGAAANNGTTLIREGTTDRTVYAGAMTASGTAGRTEAAMIAPTAMPWTQTTLNGAVARIGYSNDATPNPRWTALMLEYDVPQ